MVGIALFDGGREAYVVGLPAKRERAGRGGSRAPALDGAAPSSIFPVERAHLSSAHTRIQPSQPHPSMLLLAAVRIEHPALHPDYAARVVVTRPTQHPPCAAPACVCTWGLARALCRPRFC